MAKGPFIFRKKLKGGALALVVGICLLFSVILLLLITVGYYSKVSTTLFEIKSDLSRNIASGVNLVRANPQMFASSKQITLDLFGEGRDSVDFNYSEWGLFDLVQLRSHRGTFEQYQTVLFGAVPTESFAIYLVDHGTQLSVSGNTQIIGDAVLPRSGVSSATIGSITFTGQRLVNGSIRISQNKIPSLSIDKINRLRQTPPGLNKLKELPKTLSTLFTQPTSFYESPNTIQLNNQLSGNVVIKSAESIVVLSNAKLEGVILQAPKIIFREFFSGSVQAIATDSLTVGTGCNLKYPSSIGVVGPSSGILEVKNAKIAGAIFTNSEKLGEKHLTRITDGSEVTGIVYADGFLELYGTVNGSIYADKLLFNKYGEVRENNLVGATIDYTSLPEHFVIPKLFEEVAELKVVEYL